MTEGESLKSVLKMQFENDYEADQKKAVEQAKQDAIEPPSFADLDWRLAALAAPLVYPPPEYMAQPTLPTQPAPTATPGTSQPMASTGPQPASTDDALEDAELAELNSWSGSTSTPAATIPTPTAPPTTFTAPTSAVPQYPTATPTAPTAPAQSIYPNTSQFTSSANGLKKVILCPQMCTDFLAKAAPNSAVGNETCGVLLGKLIGDDYWIQKLFLPKQTGGPVNLKFLHNAPFFQNGAKSGFEMCFGLSTLGAGAKTRLESRIKEFTPHCVCRPNSCATHNEMDIVSYAHPQNLITLGWIHTHPTQTAFLSSVDLHTQHNYQHMLPEAVAIVCSVKHQDTRCFRLTTPHGLTTIRNCKETGFHPHSATTGLELFEAATNIEYRDAPWETIDCRH